MYDFFLRVLDALGAVVIGGILGSIALFVGVIGLTLWAGWSQNRYCERKQWRNLSRWH